MNNKILNFEYPEMEKRIEFSGYNDNYGLENEVIHPNHLIKTASVRNPELVKFIEKLISSLTKEQREKNIYFINSALGAYDYWGGNRNSDAFEEDWLLKKQDTAEAEKNYGRFKGLMLPHYKTFLQAHFFMHHNNKDPKKRIGNILASFYNDKMRRPENVVVVRRIPETKKYCETLDSGEPVETSMGFRCTGGDFCSICENNAFRREDYCDHLKYQLGNILPDGRMVVAFNRRGRFFDMSFVKVNADKISFALVKVASRNNFDQIIFASAPSKIYNLNKTANSSMRKKADIIKRLTGIAEKIKNPFKKETQKTKKNILNNNADDFYSDLMKNNKNNENRFKNEFISEPAFDNKINSNNTPDNSITEDRQQESIQKKLQFIEPNISQNTLETLAQFPLKQVLATATKMGIILKENEFIYLYNLSKDKEVKWTQFDFNPQIAMLLKEYSSLRSYEEPFLSKRANLFEKNPEFVKTALFGFGNSDEKNNQLPEFINESQAAENVASDIKRNMFLGMAALGAFTLYKNLALKEGILGKIINFIKG